jgi:hypothetical protein
MPVKRLYAIKDHLSPQTGECLLPSLQQRVGPDLLSKKEDAGFYRKK